MENEKLTWRECCDAVIAAAKAAKPGALLKYAGEYARAGRSMYLQYDIQMQAPYILSNITHWRGTKAKQVRARLKEFAKA